MSDIKTGNMYESAKEALAAGVPAKDIREVSSAEEALALAVAESRRTLATMAVGSPLWIEECFSYHTPDANQQVEYEHLRLHAKAFAKIIVGSCPPSADRTAALRLLRECVMTANASIALRGRA